MVRRPSDHEDYDASTSTDGGAALRLGGRKQADLRKNPLS